jgi:ATP-dependent RNA/DNA helicase IGHMBP2
VFTFSNFEYFFLVKFLVLINPTTISIQRWSSATFYDSRLVPADIVKSHRLCELPQVTETEDTASPLLFLDTAGCGHDETAGDDDGSRSNPGEAAIAAGHVARLIEAGVRPDQIAVVTPYSAQVRLLRDRLSGYEGLEVGTIDGLQGREKEAIVLSLVRSNERGEVGFLAELRRLNVAMTRARRHLCVIADSATIAQHEDIAKVIDWLQSAGEHRSAWGLGSGG